MPKTSLPICCEQNHGICRYSTLIAFVLVLLPNIAKAEWRDLIGSNGLPGTDGVVETWVPVGLSSSNLQVSPGSPADYDHALITYADQNSKTALKLDIRHKPSVDTTALLEALENHLDGIALGNKTFEINITAYDFIPKP